MPTFYVFNVTKQSIHGTSYPGVRIDTSPTGAGLDAIKAYVANSANGADAGDDIRAVPGDSIVWGKVVAQPHTGAPTPAPAPPAVGS